MTRPSILCVVALCMIGCSRGVPGNTPPSTELAPPAGGPKLEIESALARDVTVAESSRAAHKIVLSFRATEKDLESTNCTYILFAPDGSRIDSTSFSLPAMKKGESREYTIDNSDLPKAAHLVVRYFGK
jgi:hypothetical protein